MFREINSTEPRDALTYAIAEFIDTGKLSAGYHLEDLHTALANLSQEEWQKIKDASMELTQTDKAAMQYAALREIVNHVELPAEMVDLSAFDNNVAQLASIVSANNRNIKIRIATKSIRVPDLIARVLEKGGSQFCGLMCYSAKEAQYLFNEMKMDNLLIAYPSVQESDLSILRKLHESGATISLVVDSVKHLEILNEAMKNCSKPFPLVIDMDMSLQYLNGAIHLGVRRSPVRTLDDLRNILQASHNFPFIKVIGVMGYEAGVAGLTDRNPYKSTIMNYAANIVRQLSFSYAKQIRAEVPGVFKEAGLTLEIFNGGGTGSVNLSSEDTALTEITAGSAFFCPGFVSDFSNVQFDPALLVALQVVRSSDTDYVTCGIGGGITASGPPGADRNLRLVSPPDLEPLESEGFGEVQTPLNVQGPIKPQLGWPVFFRPAKAGESTEHFNCVQLIENGKIIGDAKTYRGVGLAPG